MPPPHPSVEPQGPQLSTPIVGNAEGAHPGATRRRLLSTPIVGNASIHSSGDAYSMEAFYSHCRECSYGAPSIDAPAILSTLIVGNVDVFAEVPEEPTRLSTPIVGNVEASRWHVTAYKRLALSTPIVGNGTGRVA